MPNSGYCIPSDTEMILTITVLKVVLLGYSNVVNSFLKISFLTLAVRCHHDRSLPVKCKIESTVLKASILQTVQWATCVRQVFDHVGKTGNAVWV